MLRHDEVAGFESAVREILAARQKELKLSDAALGTLAFDAAKNKGGKIQSIFKGQGAGVNRKPQALRLSDTLNLCEALGLPWRDVVGTALKAVKTGSGRQ